MSSDRDEEGFKEYFAEMPWLALPFDDRDGKGKLSGIFEVQGIPTLVLLDSEMKVVNADTRGAVEAGRAFPWVRYPELPRRYPGATPAHPRRYPVAEG